MSETRGKHGPAKSNIEELKLRKDGLDIWQDIEGWAKTGYDSIPKEMLDLFKWYGVYQQKPNEGHFMLRIRIPGGQITAAQARAVAAISREYARDTLDITVRQNFQLHWLTIETLPEIKRRLADVGMTSIMACGDTPRNIIGCPLAGRDKHEILNAQPVLDQVNAAVAGNRDYSNLPRKFKMSISGCEILCPQPEINDIGLYGAVQTVGGTKRIGFNLMAGGGLSTRPYFGKVMNAFVPEGQVLDVCLAILKIFREMGNRDSRKKARMKFLVDELGAEQFRNLIIEKLGYDLEEAGEARWNPNAFRDHVGLGEQKQAGYYYMGLISTAGRIVPDDLQIAAEIAEKYGSGQLANTNLQNLLILDIPENKVEEARQLAETAPTLRLEAHPVRQGVISCTGLPFCNLAVTETKGRSQSVVEYLENEVTLDTPIKIAFSGCPNSCSQYQTADIGLRGGKTRVDGEEREAYDLFVGSDMGEAQEFNTQALRAIPSAEVGPVIARILKKFNAEREPGETFQSYSRRIIKNGGSFE